MLTIRQFRYSSDNLAYLIHGKREAIAVDGGAVEEILTYLEANGLKLSRVANTHDHPDHTPGNSRLTEQTGAPLLAPMDAAAEKKLLLEDEAIEVIHTPGHTLDSICFHTGGMVITGDTLFNGTVGNCFSGDIMAFLASIKKLLALPESTVVYGGHDYVEYAMAFARIVDPDNPEIDRYLKAHDPGHVRSTLAEEMHVNPYLRFNDPKMIRILEKRGLPVTTESRRWESIMQLG
jgi:hydroxyacylglutathione hydrolase